MAQEKYDIFISYRREGGYDTAKHLNDLLVRDGYKVSFDIDTLRSGNFDTQLLERIDQCTDFILIVDQHAFDRTLDPKFNPKNDWLRRELAHALKKNKNIVPVFLSGANGFPNNLPSDIAGICMKNGPEYNRYHFNAFYEDLKKRFLKTKSSYYYLKLLAGIILSLAIIGTTIFPLRNCSNNNNPNTIIENDSIESTTENNDSIDESDEGIILQESEPTSREEAMKMFCGTFQYAEDLFVIWDLNIDPINKKVPLHMELLEGDDTEDVRYAMGWFGTYLKQPEFWEIISFNLGRDCNSALVEMMLRAENEEMTGGNRKDRMMCKIKLELDEFNNVKISFVNGMGIPWILSEDESTTFIRQ